MLIYAIQEKILNPIEVIMSNLGNGIFILNHDLLSSYIVKEYLLLEQEFGLGNFLPLEVYIFTGWVGIPILVFAVVMQFFSLNVS